MRESEHFRVEKLAEGVYAVIATEKGGGFSNAGIIDLGDRTLIFDTFETVQAGEDLRAVAEELTSGPITYVVISHLHPDHWCGNQAFPSQASIISTHHTREMMPELVKDLLSLKANPSDLEDEMLEIQEALEKEGNSLKRSSLESYIARLHQDLSSLPRIEPRLPNQTFDGKLVFYGTQRKAELLTQGKGHTESDAYLVLPDEHIMFMGDLGFFQSQPFLVYADTPAWKAQLESFLHAEIETFVPGHGALGKKSDISLMLEYITVLENLVGKVVDEGKPIGEALHQILPQPFGDWQASGSVRFERNIKALFQKITGSENRD